MRTNIRKLADALGHGATVAMVLPDHPNVGRLFTDAGLQRLREEAPEAASEGRLRAFCLVTNAEVEGEVAYRPSTCMPRSPSSMMCGQPSAPPT